MTTFIFIRHGTNDWVKQHRLPGWTAGIHLNAEGHKQAEATAARLQPIKLNAIYASHLERAIETAEHIAKPRHLEIIIRENLADLKTGDWTGRSVKQAARSKLWQDVQQRPTHTRMPGGESFSEMQGRLVAELKVIATEHPKGIVAVVSHADAIKSIVAHYLRLHLDDFQRIIISPASITIIHVEKHTARLLRLNDTTGPLLPMPPKKRKKKGDKNTKTPRL
jgi:probable phosphoglycerate mutase